MARPPQSQLDDSLRSIVINDFSGGWNTNKGKFALNSNETNDLLNVIPFVGRLQFRGGYDLFAALLSTADAATSFFDSDGARHYAIWAGGNLYDCTTGSAVVVEAAIYTAGQQIGYCDLNGVLYWSTGLPQPVPLRYWNAAAGTFGAVADSGAPGSVPPPSSDFLFLYLNQIVALAPYWIVDGVPTYQPNVMAACNTNDPTTWIAANSQAVGPNNGGKLVFGRVFGIAQVGVPPFRNLIVGRNDTGIFAYTGAFPALSESLLNCPVGCLDPGSVQYLPTVGNFGEIYFLGTDGQVWSTNGISAAPISDAIFTTIISAVLNAKAANADARFFSGYNEQYQYYWVNIGDTQFAYRWPTKAWFPMSGWPTGPTFSVVGPFSAPIIFVASNDPDKLGVYQVAQDGVADMGAMPEVYWKTPYLHGGNFNKYKEFAYMATAFLNTGAEYTLSAVGALRLTGTQMTTKEASLTIPLGASAENPFVLDSSLLDGPDVLIGPAPPGGSGDVVVTQTRFACEVTETQYIPAGHTETLKANAAQITIAYAGGEYAFDVQAVEVLFFDKGYRRSGTLYNPTAGAGTTFDPFVAP